LRLKVLWAQILSLALLAFTNAQENSSLEEQITLLEERKGYFHEKGHLSLIGEGEVLYWKASVDGVAYQTTHIAELPLDGGIGTVSTNFKTRTPHFAYDPGFRLLLGMRSSYDFFDVCLVWTRFYTEGKDVAHGSFVPGLVEAGDKILTLGIGLIEELSSVPSHASVHCNIKENVLDLELARGIRFSHSFYLRPYFGLRGVWSEIDWKISIGREFLTDDVFSQDKTKQQVKNTFDAAGGLIGLELDWKIGYGFGILARGAGALVYGLTEEKTKQEYTFLPSFSDTISEQIFHAKNSSTAVKGMWELFGGLCWQTRFSKQKKGDSAILRLFAGYELQQWPYIGQKTIDQETRERERFTLSFQGLTAGAKLVY